MNTASLTKTSVPLEREFSLAPGVMNWLLTSSPAELARRHLGVAVAWITLGLLSAVLLRWELLTPELDTLQARTFGALLSLHGFLMFYFVALPVFHGVVGHLALARWLPEGKLPFPRLARLPWLLLTAGGALVAGSFVLGGTEVGWSFDAGFGGHFNLPGTAPVAMGVLLSALALVILGVHTLAALSVVRRVGWPTGGARVLGESLACASYLALIVGPLLVAAMTLVLADAWFGFSVFAPAQGGDPQLFVLLFRFFNGPAQNMLLLGAVGTVLGVVGDRVRRSDFSRGQMMSMVAMLVASVGGWGADIWLAGRGQPVTILGGQLLQMVVFASFLTLLLSALRFLRSGIARVDTALIYALGFLVTAAQGLGIGLLLATPMGAAQFGNTQLASAQMHLMMVAVLGMGLMSGLYAGWEALTGRAAADTFGRFTALLVIVGTQVAFGPLLILGLKGASYRANAYPADFQLWQVMSFAGTTVLLAGLLLAVINLGTARKATPALRVAVALLALLAWSTGCGPRAAAQPATVQVKVSGMHCESCAENITRKLKRTGALTASDIHFSNTVQTLDYDAARASALQLVSVITNLGYEVEIVAAQP